MALPYVRIWLANFLGSSKVQELDGVSRALYLLLLVVQADRNGQGLPADEEPLRRLCGFESRDWKRAWPPLKAFFVERGGRLYNERMEKEIAEAGRVQSRFVLAGLERSRTANRSPGGHFVSSTISSVAGDAGPAKGPASLVTLDQHPSPSPSPSPSPDVRPIPDPDPDPDQTRARARRPDRNGFSPAKTLGGGGSKGDGAETDSERLTEADLRDPVRLSKAHREWVRRGYVGAGERDRLHVFAAAELTLRLRNVKNRVGFLVGLVKRKAWGRITDGDEDAARKKIKLLEAR